MIYFLLILRAQCTCEGRSQDPRKHVQWKPSQQKLTTLTVLVKSSLLDVLGSDCVSVLLLTNINLSQISLSFQNIIGTLESECNKIRANLHKLKGRACSDLQHYHRKETIIRCRKFKPNLVGLFRGLFWGGGNYPRLPPPPHPPIPPPRSVTDCVSGLLQIGHKLEKWRWRRNWWTWRHRHLFWRFVSRVKFNYYSRFHVNISCQYHHSFWSYDIFLL